MRTIHAALCLALALTACRARGSILSEQACDDPPLGLNRIDLSQARHPPIADNQVALTVIASLDDRGRSDPVLLFAVWIEQPESPRVDSLSRPSTASDGDTVRILTQERGHRRVRVKGVGYDALERDVELRAGFSDTLRVRFRTHRFCLRGIGPHAP